MMSLIRRSIYAAGCLIVSSSVCAQLTPLNEYELSKMVAQVELPDVPLLDGAGFDIQDSGIEIDLDIQTSIDSVEWRDDDGFAHLGGESEAGALILKGLHIGSSQTPISAERVRSETPFQPNELAQIHGMLVQADPQAGTLITIEQLGDAEGNGIDIIVNDIYFGQDLSDQGQRGMGLLVEDLSNFVSDDYLSSINQLFGMQLTSVNDGLNTLGGNFYPMQIRMQPIEGGAASGLGSISSPLDDLGVGGIGQTSMILDAQFVLYMKKLAIYREGFEAGIEGLMIYDGLDTTGDGIDDTVGPVVIDGLRMETIDYEIADGSSVQAMHFSNIDINMDIAMENIYIGNPETGSLGAIHIDDLHIHDTQIWIYPH